MPTTNKIRETIEKLTPCGCDCRCRYGLFNAISVAQGKCLSCRLGFHYARQDEAPLEESTA